MNRGKPESLRHYLDSLPQAMYNPRTTKRRRLLDSHHFIQSDTIQAAITMSDSTPSRARKKIGILLALVLMAVFGVFWYQAEQEAKLQAEVSRLRDLIALKNDGIALLENGELDAAIEIFDKISKELPDEPLGLQNLAIAQLMKLTVTDQIREKESYDIYLKDLRENIIRQQHEFPREAVGHALAGRLEEIERNFPVAKAQYLAAFELSQKSVPAFAYLGCRIVRDYQETYDHSVAPILSEALNAAPQNTALILTLLQESVDREDQRFYQILEHYRDAFKAFTSRTSNIVPQFFDQAEQAAKEGDWETANLNLKRIGTVLLGEVTYTQDLKRLDPHSLEWVRHEFSNELYQKYPQLRQVQDTSIEVRFVERQMELTHKEPVQAVHAEDFDLDTRTDLFYATDQTLFVVAFDEKGIANTITETKVPFDVTGICTADLDRDFVRIEPLEDPAEGTPSREFTTSFRDTDLDVVLYGAEGLRLFRNDLDESGTRTLAAVAQPDGLDQLKQVLTVASIDLDHDGDLDLVVSTQEGISLWSNRGNWTFENISQFSSLPDPEQSTTDLLPLDIERNGLIDIVLANPDSAEGLVLVNNLHGQFAKKSSAGPNAGRSEQVCAIDINRDARWDIAAVGKFGTRLSLAVSPSSGDRSGLILSEVPASGIANWDYDNDGFEDLVSWGASGLQIFRGNPNGIPQLRTELSKPFPKDVANVAIADLDADGDQDLVVLSGGAIQIFSNEGGNANGWVDLVIRAEAEPQNARERCNMHGVGSLIELKSGDLYQAQMVRGTSVHLGLGSHDQADIVRVFWTNGIPHNVIAPKLDQKIFEQQKLGGSCPFLYTWNGEQFVFCTDCLWAAPIGLQFAQGILAPSREWEYLKIEGDLLKPRDEEYVLQMTEELWEAAYYDSVKLMAVDHPADVEIFTNEKVGPAEIAEFKIHTVSDKKRPLSILDQSGRDLSQLTSQRDGNFTRAWEQSFNQGLTETHWLELDLHEFPDGAPVTLFLTGWVFPSSTSLNIAISQNPNKPKPMPPQVLVPDQNGDWVTAIEYMGFPGGKTKTIAVDLSGIFPTDDHRVRIATNMEICWDDVFFTTGEPSAEYQLTDLELVGADLHYRGFSNRVLRGGNNHATYDYASVSSDPLWPPMGGKFTRYGDVRALLSEADDCSAVLGSGDEMTVRFAVPQVELPQGWKRDFILYNIGWDKDADFNTVQGQQAEPLPFRAMSRYPYAPDESFPDSPKHRDYLKTYQTRQQDVREFRNQIRDWTPERQNSN